jgi:phosphatidylglycerol lysyltransferase
LLIGMFDPTERRAAGPAIQALTVRARSEGRCVAAYKVDGRIAAAARGIGWSVLQVAREAVVDPSDFNLDLPGRAGLRRKLRRAAAAGIAIGVVKPARDRNWQEIRAVAEEWLVSHGGERGFSMGRVQRRYLAGQIVVAARRGDRILAFASFHRNQAEWVLDILRHRDGLQDGVMHALIMGAIDLAAQAGCTRLSLAAAPVTGFQDCPRLLSRVVARLGYPNGAGLAQFKQAFAPRWEPRYLIAPGPLTLLQALLVIATEILRPRKSSLAHDDDAEIGIAPEAAACDMPFNQIVEVEDVVAIPVQYPVKAA